MVDHTSLVYHLLLMLPCEMAVGFVPCLFIVRVTVSQVTVKSFVTSTIEAGEASTWTKCCLLQSR